MTLKARVGRHAKTGGRHCQNWSEDQTKIVVLLNKMSVQSGGAGGSLNPRVIAGIAGDDLFRAILLFEEKHFPGQRSGFVDPGGLMLKRLEALAAGSVSPPQQASQAPAPGEIDILLARINGSLSANPNLPAVIRFLNGLKAEGYVKAIQNERIEGYLFGVARWAANRDFHDADKIYWNGIKPSVGRTTPFQPERMHYATPLYGRNVIQVEQGEAVILLRNDVLRLKAPYELHIQTPGAAYKPPALQPRSAADRLKLREALKKLDRPAAAH